MMHRLFTTFKDSLTSGLVIGTLATAPSTPINNLAGESYSNASPKSEGEYLLGLLSLGLLRAMYLMGLANPLSLTSPIRSPVSSGYVLNLFDSIIDLLMACSILDISKLTLSSLGERSWSSFSSSMERSLVSHFNPNPAIYLLKFSGKFLVLYCVVCWSFCLVHPSLLSKNFDAFIGLVIGYNVLSMSNSSCKKNLQISSHWERSFSPSSLLKERTLLPCNLFLRGQPSSIVISRIIPIFFLAVVSPLVAFGLISMMTRLYSGGKRCLSTSMSQSKVTRLSHKGLNTMTLSTHLSYATNSLSFSVENLSVLSLIVFKFSCIKQRGWIIPSFSCTYPV